MKIASIQTFAVSLAAASMLVACGSDTSPTASLPVEYVAVSVAELQTAEAMSARCTADEARFREQFSILEAFDGTPTVDDYYQSLDSLLTSMSTTSFHASSLAGVHPDEAVRSAGDDCGLLLTKLQTDIGLSRPVYEAVSQIDVSDADEATQFSVQKLLLAFRLGGVDKDEVARNRIRELSDEITIIGQEFDNNIREDTRYLELDSADDLVGLPEDYIAAHQPNEDIFLLYQYRTCSHESGQV